MARAIQFKSTDVAGKVPLPSDLAVAEIAINLTDGYIFTKDADGNVVTIKSPKDITQDSDIAQLFHDYKSGDSDLKIEIEQTIFDLVASIDSDVAALRSADSDTSVRIDVIETQLDSDIVALRDADSDMAATIADILAGDGNEPVDSDWVLRQIPVDQIDSDWVARVVNTAVANNVDSDFVLNLIADSEWVLRNINKVAHDFAAADSDIRFNIDSDISIIQENITDINTVIENGVGTVDSEWVLSRISDNLGLSSEDSDKIQANADKLEALYPSVPVSDDSDYAQVIQQISGTVSGNTWVTGSGWGTGAYPFLGDFVVYNGDGIILPPDSYTLTSWNPIAISYDPSQNNNIALTDGVVALYGAKTSLTGIPYTAIEQVVTPVDALADDYVHTTAHNTNMSVGNVAYVYIDGKIKTDLDVRWTALNEVTIYNLDQSVPHVIQFVYQWSFPITGGQPPNYFKLETQIATEIQQDTFDLSFAPAGDVVVFVNGSIVSTNNYTLNDRRVTLDTSQVAINPADTLLFQYTYYTERVEPGIIQSMISTAINNYNSTLNFTPQADSDWITRQIDVAVETVADSEWILRNIDRVSQEHDSDQTLFSLLDVQEKLINVGDMVEGGDVPLFDLTIGDPEVVAAKWIHYSNPNDFVVGVSLIGGTWYTRHGFGSNGNGYYDAGAALTEAYNNIFITAEPINDSVFGSYYAAIVPCVRYGGTAAENVLLGHKVLAVKDSSYILGGYGSNTDPFPTATAVSNAGANVETYGDVVSILNGGNVMDEMSYNPNTEIWLNGDYFNSLNATYQSTGGNYIATETGVIPPSDGDVLVYDSSVSLWKPVAQSTLTSGSSSTTSVMFDSEWINRQISGAVASGVDSDFVLNLLADSDWILRQIPEFTGPDSDWVLRQVPDSDTMHDLDSDMRNVNSLLSALNLAVNPPSPYSGVSVTYVQEYTASANQVLFETANIIRGEAIVTRNGVVLPADSVISGSSTSVIYDKSKNEDSALESGDRIIITYMSPYYGDEILGYNDYSIEEYTAAAGQTTFVLPNYTRGNITCTVNGVSISTNAISLAADGVTITYNPANNGGYILQTGDKFAAMVTLLVNDSVSTYTKISKEGFVGTAGQTSFTITNDIVANAFMSINGIIATSNSVSLTGNTVTYTPVNNYGVVISAGDIINVVTVVEDDWVWVSSSTGEDSEFVISVIKDYNDDYNVVKAAAISTPVADIPGAILVWNGSDWKQCYKKENVYSGLTGLSDGQTEFIIVLSDNGLTETQNNPFDFDMFINGIKVPKSALSYDSSNKKVTYAPGGYGVVTPVISSSDIVVVEYWQPYV